MTDFTLSHTNTWNGVSDLLSRLKAEVAAWPRREHDRHYLAQLDQYQRAHLGAPLVAIEREIAKPFWKA